ncbi:unnamed protein product [Bursaphelenchus okinawaensis]|uniref:enoyl-CoA hydratase n=1 Tax=Bursaphelenchus okinawaensis TaxID=465554 RepID=A0A811LGL5_9BILA|nr:unnamed protein product [Bursaphelenchus okinawaensis]CAG9123463.1 unnamed protein product [Bursaphelenchus okinawaensis]
MLSQIKLRPRKRNATSKDGRSKCVKKAKINEFSTIELHINMDGIRIYYENAKQFVSRHGDELERYIKKAKKFTNFGRIVLTHGGLHSSGYEMKVAYQLARMILKHFSDSQIWFDTSKTKRGTYPYLFVRVLYDELKSGLHTVFCNYDFIPHLIDCQANVLIKSFIFEAFKSYDDIAAHYFFQLQDLSLNSFIIPEKIDRFRWMFVKYQMSPFTKLKAFGFALDLTLKITEKALDDIYEAVQTMCPNLEALILQSTPARRDAMDRWGARATETKDHTYNNLELVTEMVDKFGLNTVIRSAKNVKRCHVVGYTKIFTNVLRGVEYKQYIDADSHYITFQMENGTLTIQSDVVIAGADLKEASQLDLEQVLGDDQASVRAIYSAKKPVIAAVNGVAYGGGCELALMCDIIVASESARFGQPEVLVGTVPGWGGTQRLTRAVGKSLAMQLLLSGQSISASEAKAVGMISFVVDKEKLLPETIKLAEKIAEQSPKVVRLIKEATNKAFELSLEEGLSFERRMNQAGMGLKDRVEGMMAFVEKRMPKWTKAKIRNVTKY